MTKEKDISKMEKNILTEKFRNDKLKDGFYYFSYKMGTRIDIGRPFAFNMVRAWDDEYLDEFLIEEVLSPVPTYSQFVKLTKKANQFSQMVKRVDKLKEVVEECRKYIETEQKMLVKCTPHYKKLMEELLTKIDEALK